MKKTIFYSIFGLITFTSCKKEYTCDCVITTEQAYYDEDGNLSETPMTSSTTSSAKFTSKKKEAQTTCEGGNGPVVQTINMGGATMKQTINTTCTIK